MTTSVSSYYRLEASLEYASNHGAKLLHFWAQIGFFALAESPFRPVSINLLEKYNAYRVTALSATILSYVCMREPYINEINNYYFL